MFKQNWNQYWNCFRCPRILSDRDDFGAGSRRNEIISFSSFCFWTNLFRAVFVHFRNLAAVPEKWPQPEIYCTAPPPSVSKAENNWVKIFARLLMTLIRVSFDPLVVWLMIQLTTNRMDTSHISTWRKLTCDQYGWACRWDLNPRPQDWCPTSLFRCLLV